MTQGSESTPSDRPPITTTTDTVPRRFERWARDTPDARAVIAGPDSLTYGQLDLRSNQLAHHLLAAGLPAGAVVAVGTDRRPELLVALLAVLKAGGAYTVLDVEQPRTGQRQLAAVEPFALLTHAAHQARLDHGRGLRVVRLGAEAAAIAERPTGPPARSTGGGLTAAYLFTGGAAPRAVAVGHTRLLAALDRWTEVVRPLPADRHLITAGSAVTAFAAGWTRPLCTGGALVVPRNGAWKPDEIRHAVESEQVTVLHTDPAGASRQFLWAPGTGVAAARAATTAVPGARTEDGAGLRALRLVTVTGDRLYVDEQAALQRRLRTGVRLLNVYGPTETAGTGTWFELPQLPGPVDDPARVCLIGTPFPGCRAELRDGQLYLTPPEGGDAVPTGDLARLRDDGLLEFGGRLRDRITLDGRSLDPHQVESVIRAHEGVGSVLVAAVAGFGGARRLVAYVAPPMEDPARPPGAGLPDTDGLREHLAGRLPAEDRPRAVVRLRTLPRNEAGQEDRDALPQPARAPAHTPPRHTGKYASASTGEGSASCAIGCGVLWLGFAARILTDVIWPGATDVTGVPQPWAFLFQVLYVFECVAFGLGVAFLVGGRPRMRALGHGRKLTAAAHLAIVYLLAAWWPQDNFYRLAAKQDWPHQAALVYVFNVPLMIAAAVVAYFATRRRAHLFDFED
ncbi:AMP-binding protein [Streptomyces sp. NPDC055254]